MDLNMHIIIPDLPQKTKNVHIEKNLSMFARFGVVSHPMDNRELLTEDMSGYDAVYMNWFENIDGGAFYMPVLRFIRRKIQLQRMKKAGIKIIFCKHNRFPHDPRYRRLSKNLYLQLLDMADVIIAFTGDAEKDLQEVFPRRDFSCKIHAILPVNYIGAYRPKPDSHIYKRLDPFKGKLVIGFIGRILPYKNAELIIKAAKESEDRDMAFFIAGEPASKEYQAKLDAMAAGSKNLITLFERLPDEEIYPALDVSDALIMPYDTKSASNSGAGRLAFSYGKTVISSDISSMNLIPEELIYKYHYDSADCHYEKMMEQIGKMYSDWKANPNVLAEKGERLLALMEKDYSEAAIQKKYEEVFMGLKADRNREV